MSTLKLLDRPIAFHRCLVDLTDSALGALLLSQAIYWQNRCTSEDGWWWKTAEQWLEETGLHRREFESARRACAPFLECERREVPAKCFYRVKEDVVQSRLAETYKLDCTNPPNKIGGNVQTTNGTETTSESTSETTSILSDSPPRYHPEARTVLHILNETAGKHFREVDQNLALISARLREPEVTLAGIKTMISRQCERWKNTPQAEYLRPETLFGKTKFESYYASKDLPVIHETNQRTTQQNYAKPQPVKGSTPVNGF